MTLHLSHLVLLSSEWKIKNIVDKKINQKLYVYSYSKNIAEELDKHVDIILAGDLVGSVLYNCSSTKVTLTEMINHSKSVRLGIKKFNGCWYAF